MPPTPSSYYLFLRYATLNDILEESWASFLAWLMLSAGGLLIGGVATFVWELLFGPLGNEAARWWLGIPLVCGIPVLLAYLDSLVAKGRDNYQKLHCRD